MSSVRAALGKPGSGVGAGLHQLASASAADEPLAGTNDHLQSVRKAPESTWIVLHHELVTTTQWIAGCFSESLLDCLGKGRTPYPREPLWGEKLNQAVGSRQGWFRTGITLDRDDLDRDDLGRDDLGRDDLGRDDLGRDGFGRYSGQSCHPIALDLFERIWGKIRRRETRVVRGVVGFGS